MADFAAHIYPGWWFLFGAATTILSALLLPRPSSTSASAVSLRTKIVSAAVGAVPVWVTFTLMVSPTALGVVLTYLSENTRFDRLDQEVVQAIETKYDVHVDRHQEYDERESETELGTWVIDGQATNCLLQTDHHWDAGHPVVTQVYAVCDGDELPIAP